MAAPTETDLVRARAAVDMLLDELGLSSLLFAVEPRAGRWSVIVECATESGWQRTELWAGPELPAMLRGAAESRAALLAEWQTHLAACKTD
jgi:hypothetical protein